ncbi:MAG: hypothetical protein ACI33P_02815 [Lysinibacillus sp.]
MAMDIAGLLSVYGGSLLNTTSSNQTNTSTGADFSNYLLNAISNPGAPPPVNGDFLSSAVSSTSSDLAQTLLSGGSSGSSLTDYNNDGVNGADAIFSSLLDTGNSREMLGTSATIDTFSDVLTSSLQAQITSMMASAQGNLQSDRNAYATGMGDGRSEGVQQTIERMQNNMSGLDNFIAERKTENSLLDALNARGSLTQYLIDKNKSSAL